MAGNQNSGRPRKSTAELKILGTFREDRHGDREDVDVAGAPKTPTGLGQYAKRVWNVTIGCKPAGVYTSDDAELLRQYCIACEKARNAEKGEFREWSVAVKEMCSLAAKLGIGPVERTKLSKPDSKPVDVLGSIQKAGG